MLGAFHKQSLVDDKSHVQKERQGRKQPDRDLGHEVCKGEAKQTEPDLDTDRHDQGGQDA